MGVCFGSGTFLGGGLFGGLVCSGVFQCFVLFA